MARGSLHTARPRALVSQRHSLLCRRLLCSKPAPVANDPYEVLGLSRNASLKQVKMAYYHMAMKHHPDHSEEPDAMERFTEVGNAYAVIMGEPQALADAESATREHTPVSAPPDERAFPDWVYGVHKYLHRLPDKLDRWLEPTYASVIYHHLRDNELAEALEVFEQGRLEGEQPTHAVYEMLIRGCTIAMHRVGPGQAPDHLTANLLKKVLELWADMQTMGRKPDYWTYNELIRAFGKAGAVKQAMVLFEKMCGNPRLLPEERALNSMYELCVLSGHYKEALLVFREHEELRLSLWAPRYTPVSFSLLLTASAEASEDLSERIQSLPRVLQLMGRYGVLPRAETCDRLLASCIATGEFQIAEQVLSIAARAGHELNPEIMRRYDEEIEGGHKKEAQQLPGQSRRSEGGDGN